MRKQIEGVPLIKQKPYWCGYTCLSMVLGYWGYDHSPDEVFEKAYTEIHGPIEESKKYTQEAAIGIGNVALAAKQLSPLRVDFWDEEKYRRAQESKLNILPKTILKAYLEKDFPCIVRLPNHYNVAIGFDDDKDSFIFNETNGQVVERPAEHFEKLWSQKDQTMPYDTRHLLLALRPSN